MVALGVRRRVGSWVVVPPDGPAAHHLRRPSDEAARSLSAGAPVALVDDVGDTGVWIVVAAARATPPVIASVTARCGAVPELALTRSRAAALDLHPDVCVVGRRARQSSPDLAGVRPTHAELMVALAEPTAARLWFTAGDGPRIRVVPDRPTLTDESAAALAAELAGLVGLPSISAFAPLSSGTALPVVAASTVVTAACEQATMVEAVTEAALPLQGAPFTMVALRGHDGLEHVALRLGPAGTGPAAVVHECVAGHVFRARSCSCRRLLEEAVAEVASAGAGVVLFLRARPSSPAADALLDTHCGAPGSVADGLRRAALIDQALDVLSSSG